MTDTELTAYLFQVCAVDPVVRKLRSNYESDIGPRWRREEVVVAIRTFFPMGSTYAARLHL